LIDAEAAGLFVPECVLSHRNESRQHRDGLGSRHWREKDPAVSRGFTTGYGTPERSVSARPVCSPPRLSLDREAPPARRRPGTPADPGNGEESTAHRIPLKSFENGFAFHGLRHPNPQMPLRGRESAAH
jgi:hypothetical protein